MDEIRLAVQSRVLPARRPGEAGRGRRTGRLRRGAGQRPLPPLGGRHVRGRVRLVLAGRGGGADVERPAGHLRHLPAVPLPPRARRADGRDDRPAVRRPAAARRRHRRGAERAPAGLPVPRVRGTPGAHAGSAGDHAPAARRREGDLPRRVLHDRDREALLAAGRRRPDPDGRGRPQVSAVRGHLRGRPDHERQGPRGHGGQGHRAVPARRQRSGQAAPGARHPVDRPRGRPVRGVGGAVVHARPARPRPPRGDRPRRAADQGGRDGPRRGARPATPSSPTRPASSSPTTRWSRTSARTSSPSR